ncbi:MAG: pyridoxamine 5'-phosphate oxidase family protein [Pirellulales bacterium]
MTDSPHENLVELLRDFDVAMLATRTADGRIRSRPMACAQVEADGTLWFFSERRSGKVEEIAHDDHVNVAMQGKMKFVSLSGQGTPVDDRTKIAKLWKESFKVWFPGGKDDPNLVLLRVRGDAGEYWDNSGTSGIKYLIEAGKAYLNGTKPDVAHDPKIHGKVEL